jgi:hypothetical protein
MQTWNETSTPQTIRTEMEDGSIIKVRRRTTGYIKTLDAQVTLPAARYQDMLDWFHISCRGGTEPTWVRRPMDGKEEAWRFTAPPVIEWLDKVAFRVSVKMEQLPTWRTLTRP